MSTITIYGKDARTTREVEVIAEREVFGRRLVVHESWGDPTLRAVSDAETGAQITVGGGLISLLDKAVRVINLGAAQDRRTSEAWLEEKANAVKLKRAEASQ